MRRRHIRHRAFAPWPRCSKLIFGTENSMDAPHSFADLLVWLSPVLAPLWLWGMWRVRRDLRRAARCGLPRAG